jgi:uncharacterized membrane protein YvbJ
MVYCAKCGKKNEDAARFCNSCGANLAGPYPHAEPGKDWERRGKEYERECQDSDRDCGGTSRSSRVFWAIIIILAGLWIIFEFGVRNIQGLPAWVYTFQFWWIIPVIIGIAIIIMAIRWATKKEPGPRFPGPPPRGR